MNDLMNTSLIKDQTGKTVLSSGHLIIAGIGAAALYMLIPSHKRKRLFK